MNLIFSSTQLDCLGLNEILNGLVEVGRVDVANKLMYNQELLYSYTLSLLKENTVQGSSFIQADTLLKVAESDIVAKIQFYDSKENHDDYNTSNMYSYLYNYLKKNGCKKIEMMNREPSLDGSYDSQKAIQLAIDMSGGENMGEISDAIKKALMNTNIKVEVKESDKESDKDNLKQKMANLGMPVDGYNPEPEEIKQPEVKREPTISEEEEEICCKIQSGNLVLLIPTGVRMNKVNIGGNEFNTLVVKLPDINSSRLQVLEIVKEEKEVKKEPVKVVTAEKSKTVEKEKSKTVEKEKFKVVEKTELLDNSDLKSQKLELDKLIKEARQRGDLEEVNRLRKERRKVRNKINKSGLKDE